MMLHGIAVCSIVKYDVALDFTCYIILYCCCILWFVMLSHVVHAILPYVVLRFLVFYRLVSCALFYRLFSISCTMYIA